MIDDVCVHQARRIFIFISKSIAKLTVILKILQKDYIEVSSFYVPYLHHKKSMHSKSDELKTTDTKIKRKCIILEFICLFMK
jgi:hypothetical protein